MADVPQLSYPMPYLGALGRGLLMGIAMGAAKLVNGRIGTGLVVLFAFTAVGSLMARFLLKTVVDGEGFTVHLWHRYDWSDVADATVSSGVLKMDLRNAGPASLPPHIIEDTAFRAAIAGWLPPEHPVRRALS